MGISYRQRSLPGVRGRGTYRSSFSLPVEVATALNRVASRLGISQSALLTQLLTPAIFDLERLLQSSTSVPPGEALKRFRGESREVVEQRVGDALKLLDDSTS